MAGTETTEPADWAELGRSSSSLRTEMSVEFMRTNRYSESQKCMFVDLDLWMIRLHCSYLQKIGLKFTRHDA